MCVYGAGAGALRNVKHLLRNALQAQVGISLPFIAAHLFIC
jgi:hypothetical protein